MGAITGLPALRQRLTDAFSCPPRSFPVCRICPVGNQGGRKEEALVTHDVADQLIGLGGVEYDDYDDNGSQTDQGNDTFG